MKRNKLSFLMVLLLLSSIVVIAQRPQYKMGTNVNSGFRNQVLLELEDTSQALVLTRVKRNPSLVFGANAYRGMIVFDSTVNQLAYYDGTAWKYPITNLSASINIYNADDALTGNRIVTMNANNLTFKSTTGNFIFSPSSIDGRVGIGTRNPQSVLHVYDSFTTGNTNAIPLQISSISPANTRLRISNMSTGVNGNGVDFFVSGSAAGLGLKKFSILKYNDFGSPQTAVFTIDSNNNVAIGAGFTTPISALHVKGAMRSDSLVLASNSLYKKFSISSDSIAVIDSIGRVMKVGVNELLNPNVSNLDWSYVQYSGATNNWLVPNATIGGLTAIYGSLNGTFQGVAASAQMTNYMYAKDSINVTLDVYVTALAARPGIVGLRLLEYSDAVGSLIQIDTIQTFVSGNSPAPGITLGSWNNRKSYGAKLHSDTRYIKLEFYVNASNVANGHGFKNVNIVTPTVNALDLNYVQGGNSFATMGILGIKDNNDLSIITNNINRMQITKNGNVGIGTNAPYEKLDVLGNIYLTNHADNNHHATTERAIRRMGQKAGNGNDGFNGLEFEVLQTPAGPAENAGLIKFYTWGSSISGTREVARIDPYGRLGIGTNNPISRLQVSGAMRADSLSLLSLLNKNNMTTRDSLLMIDSVGVVKKVAASTVTTSAGVASINAGTLTTTKNSNGITISPNTGAVIVRLQEADATNPGLVSTGVQTLAGNKTFTGLLTATNVPSGTITDSILTINTATGAVRRIAPSIIKPSVDTSIYSFDGTLKGNRIVTMNNNNLSFNSTNGNFIYNPTGTGKMGIGTITPSRRLEVSQGIASDSLTLVGSNNMLKFVKGVTGASALFMEFYKNGTSSSDYGARSGYLGFASSANNNFVMMNELKGLFQIGINKVNVFTIDSNNNVAIGAGFTTPISALHVKGAMRADSLSLLSLLNKNNMTTRDSLLMIDSVGVVKKVAASTVTTSAGVASINAGTLTTTKNSNGITISPNTGAVIVRLQEADATNPGLVSTGVQTFAGNKTFTGLLTATNVPSGTITDSILTINTATGALRRIAPSIIKPSVDTSIYSFDGTLKGNRIVTMNNNNLSFNSTNGNFIFNPTGDGKVGIGTNVPYTDLDVVGNIYLTNHTNNSHQATTERGTRRIGQKSGNGNDGFNGLEFEVLQTPVAGGTENAGLIKFYTWGSSISTNREVARIDPYGNMGIGTSTPKYKLDVKGLISGDTIVTKGIKLVDAAGNFNGYGMSGNWGITTVSDSNLKENIKPYSGPNALKGINSINIVEYDWKASKVGDPNRHMPIGVIAQNVQKVFPDAVQFDSQSGNLTLRSMLFSFYLMKATQELSKEVDVLKKENQKLSQEVNESKKANQELKQRMDKLEQMLNQLTTNQKK